MAAGHPGSKYIHLPILSPKMPGSFSAEAQAVLYGVTGGIPEYPDRVNPQKTPEENIIPLFFDESLHLFEEPNNLLKHELREPASCHSIICAIAGGASKMNETATKTGLETSGCSNQLTSLIALGIVRREYPITESSNSKKTLYRLEDNMFLFWYRFMRPNLSSIIRGAGETLYHSLVKPHLNDFIGMVFADICNTLLKRSSLFHYREKHLLIFSKSGFTSAAKAYARQTPNMHLISFSHLSTW